MDDTKATYSAVVALAATVGYLWREVRRLVAAERRCVIELTGVRSELKHFRAEAGSERREILDALGLRRPAARPDASNSSPETKEPK